MRTKNSIKNISITIFTQVIITLLGFISRKIFLNILGSEYLGINGFLTNVLSMLSLVEGGIGTSITYNLYKPLAEDDKKRVIALVQLYKKIYGILGCFIFLLSLTLYPFLGIFIRDSNDIQFIGVIYFIFVMKNIISYVNAHKWSLINADQKGYVISKYNLMFNIITTISKIIVLITTNSYIIYLIIELSIFIIQNVWNGNIVNKRYPYIKERLKYDIDTEIRNNLITNVKALFLHKVGGYCVFGTDNILISSLISIKLVGLYSNYTMIMSQLSSLLNPIINGIGASVGNLIASESKEKSYDVFQVVYMINFWIYSFCVIFLFNLIEPFINWWLGEGLLLGKTTLIIILINFYISGMRSSINTFKEKAGIFKEDKYYPIIEAIINLVVSIILAKKIGIVGIFLGTTISTISVPLWKQSKLVYNKVFNKSVIGYFYKYFLYILLTIVVGVITTLICNYIVNTGFISLIIKVIICVIIPNLIYIVIFFKTKEFKYIVSLIKSVVNNLKSVYIKQLYKNRSIRDV